MNDQTMHDERFERMGRDLAEVKRSRLYTAPHRGTTSLQGDAWPRIDEIEAQLAEDVMKRVLVVGVVYRGVTIYNTGEQPEPFMITNDREYRFVSQAEAEAFVDANAALFGLPSDEGVLLLVDTIRNWRERQAVPVDMAGGARAAMCMTSEYHK